MRTKVFEYDTSSASFVDITKDVEEVAMAGNGLVNVFAPHATAGIAVIETGSGSEGDLADAIERLLPRDDRYRHSHGSKGHGADHVLPAFISPSVTLPVIDGQIALGTWQSVVLVDTNRDNPQRKVRVSFLEG